MTTYGPAQPTAADVDAATATTQAAIDNPAASLADVERAAEAEQATFAAWRHAPERDATPGLEHDLASNQQAGLAQAWSAGAAQWQLALFALAEERPEARAARLEAELAELEPEAGA